MVLRASSGVQRIAGRAGTPGSPLAELWVFRSALCHPKSASQGGRRFRQLIAESADGYYAALLASTRGWHEQTNDPWPWLAYFTDVLARAYKRFEQRAASDRSTGTKQGRVREYVLEHAPQIFRIADVRVALPGVSDPTIRLTLEQLKDEGKVMPEGRGRSAAWVKAPGSQ